MKKILFRLILILGFVIAIAFVKFLLVWGLNIKAQSIIFFDYNPKSKEWVSFIWTGFFYVAKVTILIAVAAFGYFVIKSYNSIIYKYLPQYKPEFFIILPLATMWLLNSYFMYSYVGVYSRVDYDGPKGAPAITEYPSMVFSKHQKVEIERKISQLENDEEYEDEVSERKFLFLETAVVSGFYTKEKKFHGAVDYITSLFWALIEYSIISILYLFVPLLVYEFYVQKARNTYLDSIS